MRSFRPFWFVSISPIRFVICWSVFANFSSNFCLALSTDLNKLPMIGSFEKVLVSPTKLLLLISFATVMIWFSLSPVSSKSLFLTSFRSSDVWLLLEMFFPYSATERPEI